MRFEPLHDQTSDAICWHRGRVYPEGAIAVSLQERDRLGIELHLPLGAVGHLLESAGGAGAVTETIPERVWISL